MPRVNLVLLISAMSGSLSAGCTGLCAGAGCADEYSAGLVSVLSGARLSSSRPPAGPTDGLLTLAGASAQGPDLTVALMAGGVWVGSADEGTARRLDLDGLNTSIDASSLTIGGEDGADEFGASLAVVPDLNGDGKDELIVGAPRRAASGVSDDDGSVYVFFGLADPEQGSSVAWLSASAADLRVSPVDDTDALASSGGRLGSVVAGCADLDGDGLGDFVSSSPLDSRIASRAGRVSVGLSTVIAGNTGPLAAGAAGPSLWSGTAGARAGAALSCGVDLLGPDGATDGLPELLVGAPFADTDELEGAGAVYVIAGGAGLVDGDLAEVAAFTLTGRTEQAWLGWSLAMADLSGDGVPDLAAGAPGVRSADDVDGAARGAIYVWDGADLIAKGADARPRTVFGAAIGDGLGRGLAAADINGDGFADLIAGAPRRNPSETADNATYQAGAVYVFYGATAFSGWSTTRSASTADVTVEGNAPYLRAGQLILTGNVDGDGLTDLVLTGRYNANDGLP